MWYRSSAIFMQCDACFCACATRRGGTAASALVRNQESFGASEALLELEEPPERVWDKIRCMLECQRFEGASHKAS